VGQALIGEMIPEHRKNLAEPVLHERENLGTSNTSAGIFSDPYILNGTKIGFIVVTAGMLTLVLVPMLIGM